VQDLVDIVGCHEWLELFSLFVKLLLSPLLHPMLFALIVPLLVLILLMRQCRLSMKTFVFLSNEKNTVDWRSVSLSRWLIIWYQSQSLQMLMFILLCVHIKKENIEYYLLVCCIALGYFDSIVWRDCGCIHDTCQCLFFSDLVCKRGGNVFVHYFVGRGMVYDQMIEDSYWDNESRLLQRSVWSKFAIRR